MNIIYSKQAVKALDRMDLSTKHRIRQTVEAIPHGDIKLMEGFSDNRRRLRVGKYRVVFIQSGATVNIVEIGSRGDVYK